MEWKWLDVRQGLHRLASRSKLIEDLASAVFQAQGGGPLAKGLGILRVATILAEQLDPDPLDDLGKMLGRWSAPGNLAVEEDRQLGGWVVRREEWMADYVGDPSPESIAEQLRSRGAERGTALLIGPTGSGKSTLARRVGAELHPNGRQVRLPGAVLCKPTGSRLLRRIIETLAPKVLVFDDVGLRPYHEHGGFAVGQDQILDSLQWLHGRVFVALTIMDDSALFQQHAQTMMHGAFYYPGMRPGRVDLVLPLLPPAAEQRRRILQHYGLDPSREQLAAARGLSPAYLAELARLVQLNPDGWKRELWHLRMTAPRIRRVPHSSENRWTYLRIRRMGEQLEQLEQRVSSLEPGAPGARGPEDLGQGRGPEEPPAPPAPRATRTRKKMKRKSKVAPG